MKDNKNDSTTVLSRFGRDKRQRTVTATAERVERRPRLQRDAADSEQPSSESTYRKLFKQLLDYIFMSLMEDSRK